MRKNQENSILFTYHIVTPIFLGVLFFWNDLQPLFRWMSGRITFSITDAKDAVGSGSYPANDGIC